jgi:hypothetical protein
MTSNDLIDHLEQVHVHIGRRHLGATAAAAAATARTAAASTAATKAARGEDIVRGPQATAVEGTHVLSCDASGGRLRVKFCAYQVC